MDSKRWLAGIALVGAVTLACDGDFLFDYPGVQGGTPQDALDLGYVVPSGAEDVHIRTTSGLDVSGAWLRFDLDPTELEAFRAELEGDGTMHRFSTSGEWPDVADLARMTSCPDCPPPWWAPGDEVWFAEVAHPLMSDQAGRTVVAIDPDAGRVYRYSFMVQFWEPTDRYVPPPPEPVSYCDGELPVTYFGCDVRHDKQVALCGNADATQLQYRFGPPGAPEAVVPQTADASVFRAGSDVTTHAERAYVVVGSDDVQYALVSVIGTAPPLDGPPLDFLGVRVRQGGETIARIPCEGPPESRTERLQPLIEQLGYIGYLD